MVHASGKLVRNNSVRNLRSVAASRSKRSTSKPIAAAKSGIRSVPAKAAELVLEMLFRLRGNIAVATLR
jgi:hypothetical protein